MKFFRKNYTEKTDEELMSLLTRREHPAFDELYARYSKPMLNFFFRMLNFDREKAEDMLHDLFLKIIEKLQLFDQSKSFSTWLYTVAANMLKNEYRSRQTREEYKCSQVLMQKKSVAANEQVDARLFRQLLDTELDKLDLELKTMFTMRFMEDMTLRQIAEVFDCPEGTVKSRLFYMTKNLSAKLAAFKPEKTR